MNKHEKFLKFNGKNIVFLQVDGTYWLALKPIIEAFNLEESRYIRRARKDPFFKTCLTTQVIQVSKNGKIQGRKMTCIPEKYIYGWICTINVDNEELNSYKKTCYELLYNHFHGTITNRKELLQERKALKTMVGTEKDAKIEKAEKRIKQINANLRNMDTELENQPGLF